jgi:ribosome maturation factor RimP
LIDFNDHLNKPIELSVSGNKKFSGILIDKGTDILVIYDGKDFLYVPLLHIQSISTTIHEMDPDHFLVLFTADAFEVPNDIPFIEPSDSISLRKVLQTAKGLFVELFTTSTQTIHGYVTHVMNDYFIFYSPVYQTLYIPFHHLKYLIPYDTEQTPYSLDKQDLPLQPASIKAARTFEEQLKKFIGHIVIFDLGQYYNKVGKLVQIDGNQVELVIARDEKVYLNLQHIKTVHCPSYKPIN